MKRSILALLCVLAVSGHAWATPAGSCTAGGGKTVTVNVTNSAGGSAVLCANPLRVTLFCENTGTTNSIYVNWATADPTTTNGFLLPTNGGNISFPVGGCNSRTQSGGIGTGCVPTGQINAIGAASGTNTLVCWED